MRHYFFVIICLLVLGTVSPVYAQVPSSAEPGIISRSLEKPDRTMRGGGDIYTLPPAQAPQGQGSTQKIFVLQGVVLDQSTVYHAQDIDALYQAYIGKKVSFADLDAIARALTRRYREDGYVFSRVVLPPQKISDGIVHLRAVEGRVTAVELQGTFRDDNGLVQALADKIRVRGPANTREIERYLLLINDLPGITARAVMRPSKTPGGGELVIVVEQKTVDASASIDDRGSRYIGPWRGELQAAINNLFGRHDRTTLRADAATQLRELKYGEITHEEQIGTNGLRVTARYAVTATRPGGNLSTLGVQGDSNLFDLEAFYPLLRSRQMNLGLLAGADVNNTTTDLSGIRIADDRMRSLRTGLRFDAADGWRGVNQLELTATKGLGMLGATADGIGRSRANAKRDALFWNGTASRLQGLWIDNTSLYLSATGQYARDPLLAAEEFALGGPSFGRAYDAGELAGDRGYAGAAELRYDRTVDGTVLRAWQGYGFVDYGRVFNLSPVTGETPRDSLTSLGLGLRFNLQRDISGYVELDKPLNKKVNTEGNRNPRLFFSLAKQF